MISNCGHDELRRYSGGKAGDQTGTEWYIRSWYNHNWKCVIRFPADVREQLALNAEKAAKNNLIGYDQNERLTYYNHLKASNWDASKITIACEADCSAGVSANIIAAGYKLGISTLKNFNKSNTTSTLRAACKAVGATILTDSKYLTSDAYLLRGDLILKDGSHVCTNLTNGSKVGTTSTSKPNTSKHSSTSTSKGNAIVKTGQQHAINFTGVNIAVDGLIGSETRKMRARVLQHAINLDYKKNIAEDGIIGRGSKSALGSHYVKKGERQYMVTAAEILMMLNGINPKGVECPGVYGNGLVNAVKQKFGGDGTRISASNFLQLI